MRTCTPQNRYTARLWISARTYFRLGLGLDIRDVISNEKDHQAINETSLTQPLLFATEYALASLWLHWGVKPAAMLGHGLGEYVAAHLAGVMSLQDSLTVVAARGRLMQSLPVGRMAAVYTSAEELRNRLDGQVEIAAINAPNLCTVSGPETTVTRLLEDLKSQSIECRVLATSHAFHSAMMEPALDPFTEVFKGIALASPRIPYVSNVTGTWITPEQARSPAYYATHLRRTVQFEAGIRCLAANPWACFWKSGPATRSRI